MLNKHTKIGLKIILDDMLSTMDEEGIEILRDALNTPKGLDGLRYVMEQNGDTVQSLSKAIGVSASKLTGKSEFRLHDFDKIIAHYHLSKFVAVRIFF